MHGYAHWNSVAGLASDTACRAAGQIGESGPPRSTDVRKGSACGHFMRYLRMRAAAEKQVSTAPLSGLTFLAASCIPWTRNAAWSVSNTYGAGLRREQ